MVSGLKPQMGTTVGDAADMLGVRLTRNGPVLFVAASGVKAAPGDSVIVALDENGGEREATVVIGAGQLLLAAIAGTAGRVVRTA